MKIFTCISFLVTLSVGLAFGEILDPGFKAGPLPDPSYAVGVPADMVLTKPDPHQSQTCDFFLKDSNKLCDVKLIMFQQTSKIEASMDQIAFWTQLVSMNIAGSQDGIRGIQAFKDSDVATEFNGDSGFTVFIENPKAPFLEGHRYAMANFLYKKNLGIICEVLLFDDLNITRQPGFMMLFHLFRFT